MNFLRQLFGGKPTDNLIPPTMDINDMTDNAVPISTPEPPQPEPTHVHDWREKTVSYAPPRRDIPADFLHLTNIEYVLYGATTIIYECVICHIFNTVTMLGTTKPQLDELVDKIEAYGPQYFQRNNITYILQRYVAQPTNLPLR
jgi:hypothetical protein